MRLALVRRGWSPTGGAEAFLRRFAAAHRATGGEAILYTTRAWPEDQWPADWGPRRVLPGRTPREFADALRAARPERDADRVFSLERVWECNGYRAGDGVHAAWLRRRALLEPRWRNALHRFNPKHRQILALERALFVHGGAGRIVVNSKMVADEITAHYGADPGRIRLIYNGLPASAFGTPVPPLRSRLAMDPAAPLDSVPLCTVMLARRGRPMEWMGEEEPDPSKHSLPVASGAPPPTSGFSRPATHPSSGRLTILFAGTGWARKGLGWAIRAVDRLPASLDARLLVAGRGDPSHFPRSGRVTYVGSADAARMRALRAESDLFLLPTLYDPFSNACLEALAAGLPVVTSRWNGFAEVLPPGLAGSAVDDATDVDALTDALETWAGHARDPRTRAAARRAAAEFTIEKTVSHTLAALMETEDETTF